MQGGVAADAGYAAAMVHPARPNFFAIPRASITVAEKRRGDDAAVPHQHETARLIDGLVGLGIAILCGPDLTECSGA